MLTDVYTAGGEVLMGTLRWEKEAEETVRQKQRRTEFDHKKRELQFAEADALARITALEIELQRKRAELALYSHHDEARSLSSTERNTDLRKLRSADPVAHKATASSLGNGSAASGTPNSGKKKTRKETRDAT